MKKLRNPSFIAVKWTLQRRLYSHFVEGFCQSCADFSIIYDVSVNTDYTGSLPVLIGLVISVLLLIYCDLKSKRKQRIETL